MIQTVLMEEITTINDGRAKSYQDISEDEKLTESYWDISEDDND